MTAFYKNPTPGYYALADQSAGQYRPDSLPFHCDLVAQVQPGFRVAEVGCGTAHLCPEVEKKGGQYTGFDWSPILLKENRTRFPNANFHSPLDPPDTLFDIVASLYTIEHVTNPIKYLENLWERCRPGGLVAIICPEFIDGPALAPSIFFGITPRRLREKCKTGSFTDAFRHIIDLKLTAPRWHRQARQRPPGAFWINLQPRVLYDPAFTIDADAVHLVRLADLVWWLKEAGAEIVRTSRTMANIPRDILTYNSYILARKPI